MTSEPRSPLWRRLPIESAEPVVLVALVRLVLVLTALATVLLLAPDWDGRLLAVLLGIGLPWSLLNLVLARLAPERGQSALVAAGDLAFVAVGGAVVPEAYGAVRFTALFFLAVHANLQGERIGLGVAGLTLVALAVPAALQDRGEVRGDLLVFYESVFAVTALATVVLVGRLRTTESASRLRARELSRRTLEAEQAVRRSVSESLHDGPLQELIGLDMVLTAAQRQADKEGAGETSELLTRARETAGRNVRALRDEMLGLGPYAYEELSLEAAIERCIPVWERRYDLRTTLRMERLDLPSETEGALFRIIQEAVVNAAKHGHAESVTIDLHSHDGRLELSVADDGRGFGGVGPLGAAEPGHIGLAGIRERAELLGGELSIESSDSGSTLLVAAPYAEGG